LNPVGVRAVPGQKINVFNRQIEFALTRVQQLQAVVRRLLDLQRLQPLIPSDAVIQVDHQVAEVQEQGGGADRRSA